MAVDGERQAVLTLPVPGRCRDSCPLEATVTPDVPDWVRDAVFYQIFPDRFATSARVAKPGPLEPWDAPPTHHGFKGGDLIGIAEHLPYLEQLGVNALYLTPIFSSASNHRYHTYDYLQVDPLLGGNDALRVLLDAAHDRDMRVILDGVFNHTGRGFWPFHHVLETGARSPYRRWFHFDQEALEAGLPVLAYPGAIARSGAAVDEPAPGETSPERDGTWSLRRLGYRAWWDLPALPKLNTDEPEVREYLLSVAEHWIRFGADGWRLDVPAEIQDETFWQEFRRRVRAVNPEAYLVGEIWRLAPDWLRGDRFDALMNYPLAEAILSFTGADHLDDEVLRTHHEFGPNVWPTDGPEFVQRVRSTLDAYDPAVTSVQLNLLDSHDSPRFHTFVGGDRPSYRLAVFLQATLPGAPCIYYGDEIGMEGAHDPGCRGGFPWDEEAWDGDLRAFVAAAMSLRHAEPALRRGEITFVGAGGRAVAFERRLGDRRLLVAVNAGETPATLDVSVAAPAVTASEILPEPFSGAHATVTGDGTVRLAVPPRTGAVLALR